VSLGQPSKAQGLRTNSGSLAIFAAILLASSLLSSLARQPIGFTFKPWICVSTYSSGVANLHYSSAKRF